MEIDALKRGGKRTLEDSECPLRSRMGSMSSIRERTAMVEQQIVEMEATAANRSAEESNQLARLEMQATVADSWEEMERQNRILAGIEDRV